MQELVEYLIEESKQLTEANWRAMAGGALIAGSLLAKNPATVNATPVIQHQVSTYSDDQIANAIYKAEGGSKTKHPYGILAHYKHTTPRQACINTIRHARRDWDGKGDFIVFLGSRYCPIGAKNDPKGLNKNWVKNVKYWLHHGGD